MGEILALGGNLFVESIPGGMAKRDTDSVMMDAYRAPFPDYWSRVGVLAFQRDIPLTERDRSARLMGRIHERLEGLDVPLKLIWGMRDRVFQPMFLDQWLELFPAAEVLRLEDAAHFVVEDRPDARGRRAALRGAAAGGGAARRGLDRLHVAREDLHAQAVAEDHVQDHAAEALGERAGVVDGGVGVRLGHAAGLEEAARGGALELLAGGELELLGAEEPGRDAVGGLDDHGGDVVREHTRLGMDAVDQAAGRGVAP